MNFYRKIISAVIFFTSLVCLPSALLAGEYLPGDFHQHTLYTDGSDPFFEVMGSNVDYGLQWWANSEHGGRRNRDGEGVSWLDTDKYPVNPIMGDNPEAGYMYRWQSLRDFVYPDIQATRINYPDKTIVSGVEWNVPGHEHCSVAMYQSEDIATAISEFEYRFDRSDPDTSRNDQTSLVYGFDLLAKNNSDKADAIMAVEWMQAAYEDGVADSWIVPAHVERASSYLIEDFRAWQDVGKDVAIGMEGAPGHQTSGDRGFSRGSLGGGTFGGTGFFVAKVGGLWDALAAEDRKFFNFASSDYHNHWTNGGSDFWPGEYQKNYTYIETNAADQIQAVFDGVRSGNSWNVQGDLIDELELTAKSKNKTAMMGQTLEVKAGKQVQIKIKVHDPAEPNFCPLNMDNPSLAQIGISQPLSRPVLDHIDLIAGTITGNVPTTNQEFDESVCEGITDPEDLDECLFGEWQKAVAATDYGTDAAVIKTFERNGGKDKNGYMTYVMNIKPEKSMFIRVRGTNLPANVPFETDADGNPLADTEADENIYDPMEDEGVFNDKLFPEYSDILNFSKLGEVAEAYADLWFYSNPIYIKVVK